MSDVTKITETGVLPDLMANGGSWNSQITRENTSALYDENHKYGINIKSEYGVTFSCSEYGILRPQLLSGEGHVLFVPELSDVSFYYGLVNVEKGLTVINGTKHSIIPYFISTLSQATNSKSPTNTAPTIEAKTWGLTFAIPSGGALILDTAGGGTAFVVIEVQ